MEQPPDVGRCELAVDDATRVLHRSKRSAKVPSSASFPNNHPAGRSVRGSTFDFLRRRTLPISQAPAADLRAGQNRPRAGAPPSMRLLSVTLVLLSALPAGAFMPGEVVRLTRGEMLQFQSRDLLSAAKGQEFPVLQHDAARRLVQVPFVKPDGTTIVVTLPADALEAVPRDGWQDLLAGLEAFRDQRVDVAQQLVARAAKDEKWKALATAVASRLQAALTTRSAAALQTLRDAAVQLDKLGHQSLALALEEGTDRLGGPSAPSAKTNREDLKERAATSARAVARTRQAFAMRCLTNAEQEIHAGLEAEPARPELKVFQDRVKKELEEAAGKYADADRMRQFAEGMPHALTALEMGLKLCHDHPQLLALKKELAAAFEEKTAPPVNAAFLAAVGGGDARILAEGHRLYTNRCTECHDLELLDSRSVTGWQKAIAGMARRAGVNGEQQARMLDYITAAQKVVEKQP